VARQRFGILTALVGLVWLSGCGSQGEGEGPTGFEPPPSASPTSSTSPTTPASGSTVPGAPSASSTTDMTAPTVVGTTPVPVPTSGATTAPTGSMTPPPTTFDTLRAAADNTDRLIGVALENNPLGDGNYTSLAAREFNYVTPVNEMKWDFTEPQPGQFNFSRADNIVNFATSNNMAVKGHTLIWYRQLPNWVNQLNGQQAVRDAMNNHIRALVSRYRGRVRAWDVVNEAWEDDGVTLRNHVFQRVLGQGYIDEAFRTARAADPDARLYYNDFGTEDMSQKANAVYDMVVGMLQRGVPIDGVGLQMHTININGAPTISDFIANIDRLAALGLDVIISEMDVSTCGDGTVDERLAAQRTRVYNLIGACVSRPACKEITFWGLTDQYSWLLTNPDISQCENGQDPLGLLFDRGYQKKPAYSGVMDAFKLAQ
jgi:endo-1,4-beta-xylanase